MGAHDEQATQHRQSLPQGASHSTEQEHHHEEQVCHALPVRPREDVPVVQYSAEDHASVAQSPFERSGQAPSWRNNVLKGEMREKDGLQGRRAREGE